jgi:hypothetical protein
MNAKRAVAVVCLANVCGVLVLILTGGLDAASLPGRPATEADLSAWQGAICGLTCGTTGNNPCGPVTHDCAETGRLCDDTSDACGTCSGGKHITCQAAAGAQDWCSEYSERCCLPPGMCSQTDTGCKCDPGSIGENERGTRIMCGVEHNSRHCSGS